MKKLFLVLLTLTCITSLWAANDLKVSGKLIDGSNNEPFAYVNIALYNTNNQLISGAMSDIDGHFELFADKGDYILTISFVGYKSYKKALQLSPLKPHVRLNTIIMEEDAKLLKEVEVTGQKFAMQLELDKKVFNVADNILAEGASASEVLPQPPCPSNTIFLILFVSKLAIGCLLSFASLRK